MASTGLEQRKLTLISRLIRTEDAEVIGKVEKLLAEVLDAPYEVSEDELKYRATKALEDIESGNVLSQEDAEREAKDW